MSGVSKRMPCELWFQTEETAKKVQSIMDGRIKALWSIGVDDDGKIVPMLMYRFRYKLNGDLKRKRGSLTNITLERAIVILIEHYNGLIDIKSYKELTDMWVFEIEDFHRDKPADDGIPCVHKAGEKKVVFQPKEPKFMAKMKKARRMRL